MLYFIVWFSGVIFKISHLIYTFRKKMTHFKVSVANAGCLSKVNNYITGKQHLLSLQCYNISLKFVFCKTPKMCNVCVQFCDNWRGCMMYILFSALISPGMPLQFWNNDTDVMTMEFNGCRLCNVTCG